MILGSVKRRREFFAGSLTLIALAFSVNVAYSDSDLRQSEYVWSTSEGNLPGVFQLSRGWPEILEVRVECDAIEGPSNGVIFSTDGLTLKYIDGFLQLVDKFTETRDLKVETPERECPAGFKFDSNSGDLSLFAGMNRDSERLTSEYFPEVNSISAPTENDSVDVTMKIVTQPWGQETSRSRYLLAAASILLAFASSMLASRREEERQPQVTNPGSASKATTVCVAVVLASSALLIPPFLDDGWVLNRLNGFLKYGAMSNLYDANDAWLPQGNLHEWLLALVARSGIAFIGLRLIVVGILVIAWEVLRRFVLGRLLAVGRPATWIAASVFSVFSIGWLITLRAEPWIVLYAAISWAGVSCLYKDSASSGLFFALTGAGLAITAHQAGWTVAAPAILAMIIAVRRSAHGELRRSSILLVVLNSGAISVTSLCLLSNLPTILRAIQDFQSASSEHSYFVFSELLRYQYLFSMTSSVRLASILILLIVIVLSAVRLSTFWKIETAAWTLAMASLSGLLLTSSKWAWHFGAYAVPATVFAGLAFSRISSQNPVNRPLFSILIPSIVLVAGTSSAVTEEWGLSDLVQSSWSEFAEKLSAPSNELPWFLVLLLSIAIGALADLNKPSAFRIVAVATTVLATLSVPVLALGWIAKDAIEADGWSYPNQNVRALKGHNDCDEARFFAGLQPLPSSSSNTPEFASLVQGALPDIPSLEANRPPIKFAVWGTWSTEIVQSLDSTSVLTADTAMGEYESPVFDLADVRQLSFWAASGGSPDVEFSVVFTNDADIVEPLAIEPTSEATWEIVTVDVRPGATKAFVRISDRSSGIGGWGAVSALAGPDYVSADEINAQGTVFVGPFEAIKYPCLKLALPDGGVWPHFDFVTEEATGLNLSVPNIPLTDTGCSDPQITCIRKTDYQLATANRRDL